MDISKKKKILLEAALALAAILAIIFVVIQLLGVGDDKIDTTLALSATDSEIVGVDAYIIRDESVVLSGTLGVAEYAASDGEKLPSGSLVANVHSVSGIDASALQTSIDAIDRTIKILEKSNRLTGTSLSDVKALSAEIDSLFTDVLRLAGSGEMSQLRGLLDELLVMMNRYEKAIGNGEDLSQEILDLKARKSELLGAYKTGSQSVTASESGYFYRDTDGYESIFSRDKLDTLTYEEFDALTVAQRQENPYAIGKIISSYSWYVVLKVSESVADKFPDVSDGRTYAVRFAENSDRVINMELYRKVSSGGGALLILESDEMPTDFDYQRLQNVTVTISEHSGYRVPADAIRVLDGQLGVYTVDSNREVHFKKIKTLYVSDAYTIVAENDGSEEMEGYLSKNDVMIVSGKNIYEGKIIG